MQHDGEKLLGWMITNDHMQMPFETHTDYTDEKLVEHAFGILTRTRACVEFSHRSVCVCVSIDQAAAFCASVFVIVTSLF